MRQNGEVEENVKKGVDLWLILEKSFLFGSICGTMKRSFFAGVLSLKIMMCWLFTYVEESPEDVEDCDICGKHKCEDKPDNRFRKKSNANRVVYRQQSSEFSINVHLDY